MRHGRRRRRERDTNAQQNIANDPLDSLLATPPQAPVVTATPLIQPMDWLNEALEAEGEYVRSGLTEDNRQFHPDGNNRWPRDQLGRPARTQLGPAIGVGDRPGRFSSQTRAERFWSRASEMERAVVCTRRKIRKEVLHALHKTGKGGGKPYRFNWKSRIKC